MTAVVIDTSMTMAWCFEDEASDAADAVLGVLVEGEAVVPGLWPFEVANVLLVAQRRGRISHAQAERFLALLHQLPIEVDAFGIEASTLVAVGRRHGLSAYDAGYLVLAERRGLPLATLDAALRRACADAGVELLPAG